jgi:hypothetical protein
MLRIVNEKLQQYIPGLDVSFALSQKRPTINAWLQVSSIRHGIDTLSKKAAERHVGKAKCSAVTH